MLPSTQEFLFPSTFQSPTGAAKVHVVPFTTSAAVPKLVMIIRTDKSEVYEATLDGHPAMAVVLGPKNDRADTCPHELAQVLCQQWDVAQELAVAQRAV